MTKLIIQIPCLNEAEHLPVTIAQLPRQLAGVDELEWLVIDDGSSDGTSEVALRLGVDHVVRLEHHRGLAQAFVAGLDEALRRGADIIVNTDADNQYSADDIAALIEPILKGEAELVIGDRDVGRNQHFSATKRALQVIGSLVVRQLTGTPVRDATSGFRAISRGAAMRINVFSNYTYTLETIIQAGTKGMKIKSVAVRTNPPMRESRLLRSKRDYIFRSLVTMTRIFITYRPLKFFGTLGMLIMLPGVLLDLRFLYFLITDQGHGNIQSLILSAIFLIFGFIVCVAGLLADIIAVNRMLLEEIRTRVMKLEYRSQENRVAQRKSPE